MKIVIDKTKCIGCNMCEDMSGGDIGTKYGKDGKAEINLKIDLANDGVKEAVLLAVEVCPMRAIEVIKDQ